MATLKIVQSDHQTISVVDADKKAYKNGDTVATGKVLTASIKAETGYTAGALNKTSVTVSDKDTEIEFSATAATIQTFTLTITQSDNQTITVSAGDKTYTATTKLPYNTAWTATIAAKDGYTAGTLNKTSGTLTADDAVSATAATINTYTLTITQSEHQTITVNDGKKDYTATTKLPYGTKWTATIKADEGYTAGALSKASGTITADDSVSAAAATVTQYTLTITQSEHQTITVNDGKKDYTATTKLPYNTAWTAKIAAEDGYIAGTLNKTSGTLTADDTVSATAATAIKTYTFTITQSEHQTITVTANGKEYTDKFTANEGTTWTAKVVPEDGYVAGTLAATSGTLSADYTLTATAATKATGKTYTLTITQSEHQTITVSANGLDYTSTFTANEGTAWTAAIKADDGYTAGTLSKTSGTLTADDTVSATAATKKPEEHKEGILTVIFNYILDMFNMR